MTASNPKRTLGPSGHDILRWRESDRTITGKASPTAPITTYATGPNGANLHYSAQGVIDQMELGNGLLDQTNFNSLLQVVGINLGTSLGANNVWGISNGYASGSNNGNLLSQGVVATGMGAVNQTFLYDALDRLTLATENPTNTPTCPDAGSQWCEQFSYDVYGNRGMHASSNTGLIAPASFDASNHIADPMGNLNQDFGAQATYKVLAGCTWS